MSDMVKNIRQSFSNMFLGEAVRNLVLEHDNKKLIYSQFVGPDTGYIRLPIQLAPGMYELWRLDDGENDA